MIIVRRVAVELSIEDPNGDAILLTLYNFPGLFLTNSKVLEAHFPIGTVMAIREPWMKIASASSHQNVMIRVDSPSDVVILEPSNPNLQGIKWGTTPMIYRHTFTTVERWKEQGNKHFKDALFVPAALAWSRGLELDPSLHALYLNRSQAYIKLEWFSAALADAAHVLSAPELHMSAAKKAAYRAASAEYGLGRYRDALARLETLDEDIHIKSLKSRCRQRTQEATTGEYAWIDMLRAGQHAVPHLDVAEFVDPAVGVAPMSTRGGGRGIRSMRDIKTGELLVSCQVMIYLPTN
jgi:tetratricopeptide (TPR) repeat protein